MRRWEDQLPAEEKRRMRKGMYILPSLFTAANIGAGYYALSQPEPAYASDKKAPVVRVVQPAIDQEVKMDTDADRTAKATSSAASPAELGPETRARAGARRRRSA